MGRCVGGGAEGVSDEWILTEDYLYLVFLNYILSFLFLSRIFLYCLSRFFILHHFSISPFAWFYFRFVFYRPISFFKKVFFYTSFILSNFQKSVRTWTQYPRAEGQELYPLHHQNRQHQQGLQLYSMTLIGQLELQKSRDFHSEQPEWTQLMRSETNSLICYSTKTVSTMCAWRL